MKNVGFFKTGKAGCPDITVLHDGQFIGLEVKNEKGKQSDNQKVGDGYCRTVDLGLRYSNIVDPGLIRFYSNKNNIGNI